MRDPFYYTVADVTKTRTYYRTPSIVEAIEYIQEQVNKGADRDYYHIFYTHPETGSLVKEA